MSTSPGLAVARSARQDSHIQRSRAEAEVFMFTVQYEPDEAELQASLEINLSAPHARRRRLMETAAAVVVLVTGVTLLVSGGGAVGVLLIVLGVLYAALLVATPTLAKASIKLRTTPTTVTVADDGITVTTARGTRVTPWGTVRYGVESHLGWSLMGKPPVGLLPRRALSADQQAEFAALVALHIGSRLRWAGPKTAYEAGPNTA
jgi:hypothetical protein